MIAQVKEPLGKPDVQLAGLKIWIHGRQFPDCDDYWDGNWLNVTAFCGTAEACVWTGGHIIHLSEISHFRIGAARLYQEISGEAELPCLEPELAVELKSQDLGHIEMIVNITPDSVSQAHRFIFNIDQSYLPPLIADCDEILEKYPLVGEK
ncbi:hypothetical protein ACFL27_26480 [candidate division CSSED10-310 bacterium]|uniref:Uncharacterized protein n=1 Tax=candidate division CSSED10-310 bacterium TaxID=2855610 RepID=A0ABV6Z5M1_UNCC1